MSLKEIARNIAFGAVPGMIGYEEAQAGVFRTIAKQIESGARADGNPDRFDKIRYNFDFFLNGIPDVVTYVGAIGLVFGFASQRDYDSAAAVSAGFLLLRGYAYSEFREKSDSAREEVSKALDSRVIRESS